MDAMSLSLDEIIKKKSIGKRPKPVAVEGVGRKAGRSTKPNPAGKKSQGSPAAGGSPNGRRKIAAAAGSIQRRRVAGAGGNRVNKVATTGKPRPIVDARMKIIQKKRAQIRDARDKLVEIARNSGDARLRLLKRKGKLPPPGNGILKKSPGSAGGKPYPDSMDVDYDLDVVEVRRPVVPLKRTVRNEMFTVPSTMPPLPTFSRSVRSSPPPQPSSSSWSSDPFDCYEVHTSRPTIKKSHPVAPPPHYDELPPRRGIMRARSPPSSHPIYVDDRPHLSSTMRARLERAPNPGESMGIFSKMPPEEHPSSRHHHHHPSQPLSPSPSPPISGYRIVVSNLHSSVTQNDIKELFEDIGDLLESRLVRPGVAEVIYRTLKDAEEAVDTYHNRQLDGQPMKCLLVKPRSFNKPTAPAISYSSSSRSHKPFYSSSGSKNSSIEIDIDALHTVLFRREH
ncbi:polymerase delta-interacting protein 3-like [Uranotaenia lowii]|uniref:polymerase delta-interacting protein 3-like n=1 Tax=Uranotaenia lowii TaxID=190385 RepID=UPI0024793BA8|nr:polymerase delta-interacting protein 3-like [Uranotaenia lowii]